MKTKNISVWATHFLPLIITAMAIVFTNCSGNDDPAPEPMPDPELSVTPESIPAAYTAGTYSIDVTSNTTWTAVSDNTSWCTVKPATGTNNGAVSVNVIENTTADTRAAIVTFAAGTLIRTVAVTQDGAIPPPPSVSTPPAAASTRTWTFDDQMWSDAIHIPACNQDDFTLDLTTPYCRSYTVGETSRYYYNWVYVSQNATELCPTPWRVPSESDFNTLVSNTDYSALIAAWGYGGSAYGNEMDDVNTGAYYWSSMESGAFTASDLSYYNGGLYVGSHSKRQGFQVRCVK
ncbi:MAG: hypothetical protein LBT61_00100 [Prevotellaceae bacterium]|jgi:hypothetical protein|nr:hypothetical protein [Prevotellaceae bacterium]